MTFLPVVERELRAAARRKGTFRARWWTAAIATAVTLASIAILNLAAVRAQGGALFASLTAFAFGLTLLAGVLLTADALAEEKRMGTLGLLFLTDLKGYDVVLGKLAATSLNAAYALLGLVPAIGLILLLGGVTGNDLVRVALALLNSLFVSLAAGLMVSAFMTNTQRAMTNTIGLLFLLVFVVPFLALVVQWEFKRGLVTQLAALSPLHAFQCATRWTVRSGTFALYLLASNLVGWCFILAASWRLPRFAIEQDTRPKDSRKTSSGSDAVRHPGHAARRQRLLSISPVLWLLSGEPATRLFTLVLVGAWVFAVLVFTWVTPVESSLLTFQAATVCGFLLNVLIAIHACRFFVQARANGALELLATTPLTNLEILKGQWLHLKRLFLWPVLVFWTSTFIPVAFAALAGKTPATGGTERLLFSYWGGMGLATWFTVNFSADLITVVLVGIWLGLKMRKPALAPAWTILLVLVLPSVLCGLGIVVDIILALWAYNGLKNDFRYVSPGLAAR
jgi:hypothetical protein